MKPQTKDVTQYLKSCDIIDFEHQTSCDIIDFGHQTSCEITALAYEIKSCSKDEISYIKNAFEYVRDNISHSADIRGRVVTCKASEVLRAKEGICYAKSHLLAALLRCNQIPAGFCYQRLILDDETAPHLILHGLNAVYIKSLDKWIRLDARGNKPGVDAQFSTNDEKLAFLVRTHKGEEDILTIFSSPDENVIKALTKNKKLEDLWRNLPTELRVSIP